jgi:hypothetical protein
MLWIRRASQMLPRRAERGSTCQVRVTIPCFREWLETGEELIEYAQGTLQGAMSETIVALTNRYIRLGGPTEGRTIPLEQVR